MNTLIAPAVLKELLGLEADLAALRAHALDLGCTFATRELVALAIKVIPTLYDGASVRHAAQEKPPCFHS